MIDHHQEQEHDMADIIVADTSLLLPQLLFKVIDKLGYKT